MRRKADWLGWSLQFMFGSLIGALLGFVAISRRPTYIRHSGWSVTDEVVTHFIIGAALLGGAIASHYGDRLWTEYRVIPPDGPDQSSFSVLLSVLAGAAGVALMAFAILRTFGVV